MACVAGRSASMCSCCVRRVGPAICGCSAGTLPSHGTSWRCGRAGWFMRPTQQQRGRTCKATDYNDPAFYSSSLTFDHRLYWDERYKTEGASFEWYRTWDSLRPVLAATLAKATRILQVGVGTSTLQEDMVQEGYESIMNVDYSPVCIAIMQERQASRRLPGLAYEVADCRAMPQFGDASFDVVLDKGTLDALLCADDDEGNSRQMMQEVSRIINSGGKYVWCTSGSPKGRLPYLEAFGPHDLQVYEIGQQGSQAGPLCTEDALAQFPSMVYSHFVYVLTKT